MLKLSTPSRDPFWLDILPGVRIQFRPISVADMLVARTAPRRHPSRDRADHRGRLWPRRRPSNSD